MNRPIKNDYEDRELYYTHLERYCDKLELKLKECNDFLCKQCDQTALCNICIWGEK